MKNKPRSHWQIVISVFLALALAFESAPASYAAPAIPSSMAALGDSITVAYNTGAWFAPAPANSWSTGTNATVNSMYLRFLAQNPAISGNNVNLAVPGKKMVDLNGQASQVGTATEYVTILMGANDVCTSSVSTMTSVATFRSQFETAMNTLTAQAPNATIYVVSIPNVYLLYDLFKGNSTARFTWSLYQICQSLLANPLSTRARDVKRRAAVQQRNVDFNTQLAEACALYPNCVFDNNVAFNTAYVASDVSTRDYFHPSLAGQTKLANVAWGASGFGP